MLDFVNDYSEGAHEKILQRLLETNMEKMCEMTLKSNEKTVAIILHKLQENFELED